MRFFIIVFLLCSCGVPEMSPWETNTSDNNLTFRELSKMHDDGDNKFKFAIVGDPQAVVGYLSSAIDRAYKHGAEFLVIVGDMTDRGLKREFEWVIDAINSSPIPVITVVGNHDGINSGKRIYNKAFGPLNYTFEFGGVNFIAWNNNGYEWDVDFDFLENSLKLPNTIVLSHQPPNSGTLNEHEEDIWRSLRLNSDMIASLHGHMHNFSFYVEDGTVISVSDRVAGSHFSLVEVDGSNVSISNCSYHCARVQ